MNKYKVIYYDLIYFLIITNVILFIDNLNITTIYKVLIKTYTNYNYSITRCLIELFNTLIFKIDLTNLENYIDIRWRIYNG